MVNEEHVASRNPLCVQLDTEVGIGVPLVISREVAIRYACN